MLVRLCAMTVVLTAGACPVFADSLTYNAFDLASGEIPVIRSSPDVKAFENGLIVQSLNELRCQAVAIKKSLLVQSSKPDDGACSLFTQAAPARFYVERRSAAPAGCATNTVGCAAELSVDFDKGSPLEGTLSSNTIHLTNYKDASGVVCLSSFAEQKWFQEKVQLANLTGFVQKTPPDNASVYLHPGDCGKTQQPIYALTPPQDHPKPTQVFPDPDSLPRNVTCKRNPPNAACDPYPHAADGWDLFIDEANEQSIPRVTLNPNNYVSTNSFGRVWIRHWKSVTPSILIGGSNTALTVASTDGGTAAVTDNSTLGPSLASVGPGDERVSVVLIPPHAPGTMHLSVKFADATDATKPKGDIGVDVVVDKAYSGTFRFGISHVFFAPDDSFSSLKRNESSPAEIVRHGGGSNELVIAYAFYWDGFGVVGRRYFLIDKGVWATIKRHAGIYAGFGAVSYTPGTFDFLKSMHIGVEWELSRNLSLAATFVLRRTDELADGYAVGAAVPASGIPTDTHYIPGFGLTLNFSLDFLKTAAGGAK